jgi:CheY-like chemotaxis protein
MEEESMATHPIMQRDAKVNVLIVDNDDRILCTFQQLLENAGFNTTTTWSGHEALSLLRSGVFDVLLVDDYLPDLHSHNFLEQVNHLPIQPSIVVMHNDPAKPADLQCYESLGVSGLVDKHDAARVFQAVSFSYADQPLARKPVN